MYRGAHFFIIFLVILSILAYIQSENSFIGKNFDNRILSSNLIQKDIDGIRKLEKKLTNKVNLIKFGSRKLMERKMQEAKKEESKKEEQKKEELKKEEPKKEEPKQEEKTKEAGKLTVKSDPKAKTNASANLDKPKGIVDEGMTKESVESKNPDVRLKKLMPDEGKTALSFLMKTLLMVSIIVFGIFI